MHLVSMMKQQVIDTQYDAVMFIPDPKKNEELHIEFLRYKDGGSKYSPNELGDWHDIFLFQTDSDGDYINKERFSAILLDPIVYAGGLAKSGVYGIIGKKTTTSNIFFDNLEEKWDTE